MWLALGEDTPAAFGSGRGVCLLSCEEVPASGLPNYSGPTEPASTCGRVPLWKRGLWTSRAAAAHKDLREP
jgi:hypothetical protein